MINYNIKVVDWIYISTSAGVSLPVQAGYWYQRLGESDWLKARSWIKEDELSGVFFATPRLPGRLRLRSGERARRERQKQTGHTQGCTYLFLKHLSGDDNITPQSKSNVPRQADSTITKLLKMVSHKLTTSNLKLIIINNK